MQAHLEITALIRQSHPQPDILGFLLNHQVTVPRKGPRLKALTCQTKHSPNPRRIEAQPNQLGKAAPSRRVRLAKRERSELVVGVRIPMGPRQKMKGVVTIVEVVVGVEVGVMGGVQADEEGRLQLGVRVAAYNRF